MTLNSWRHIVTKIVLSALFKNKVLRQKICSMLLSSFVPIFLICCCVQAEEKGRYFTHEEEFNLRSGLDPDKFPYGIPAISGLYSYLVTFLLKPGQEPEYEKKFKKVVKDHSVERFLASGIIISENWIRTKAKPLAYFRIQTYWIVTDGEFDIPVKIESLTKYDVDRFALYKKYRDEEDIEHDVALVRVKKPLKWSFNLRSVNSGMKFHTNTFFNCFLLVWNWRDENSTYPKSGKISKAIIPVHPRKEKCDEDSWRIPDYIRCMQQDIDEFKYQFREPCAINLGAPIICDDHQLYGIYIGYWGKSECDGRPFRDEYHVIDMYAQHYDITNWMAHVASLVFHEYNFNDTLRDLENDLRTLTTKKNKGKSRYGNSAARAYGDDCRLYCQIEYWIIVVFILFKL